MRWLSPVGGVSKTAGSLVMIRVCARDNSSAAAEDKTM